MTKTLEKLDEVVRAHPDLIILTDDVYGTFVDGFRSVYSVQPYNTILVYSYSKLYGATGWRIGMIAMNEDNVVDRLVSQLSAEDKRAVDDEYRIVTGDPASMRFIDRMCADSRSIGLYHTSGLSTPLAGIHGHPLACAPGEQGRRPLHRTVQDAGGGALYGADGSLGTQGR